MTQLSKSKLLSFAQCPRKLWLELHRPELAAEDSGTEALMAAGHAVGDVAREVYGRGEGHLVTFENGMAGALETTRELIARGGTAPIFEATFAHDGVLVRTDVLERSNEAPRLIEVKSSGSVKDYHLLDCAIQAWTLRQVGLPLARVSVAYVDTSFVYDGGASYDGLFAEEDVTAAIEEQVALVPDLARRARATVASEAEPEIAVGAHCAAPFDCAFFDHCAPAQGQYPVWGLRGRKERLFDLVHAGYRDLRDVPEDELRSDQQRRIQRQTKLEAPYVGDKLRDFVRALAYPRYFLDFETIMFAVPIWPGTRPYEQLPFQFSCRIDGREGGVEHAEFLDLSGAPPMRACANRLIEALGTQGPILVYSSFERQRIAGLAARFGDLAPQLNALLDRLVDLHPPTKAHYYHPDMHGSWSIKDVAPTIAPELRYETLGEVRDGGAAGRAYLEAINPATSAERRSQLQRDMLEYCGHDTLALLKLVELFSAAAPSGVTGATSASPASLVTCRR